MRKLILMAAAAITAAGYIIVAYFSPAAIIDPDKLAKPDAVPAGLVDALTEGLAPHKYINALVNYIVDGDTIKVVYNKEEYTIRLLCIDTPESVKQGVELQRYSKEASKMTEKLSLGKQVRLVFENSLRDRYGRLLAYVILENGSCLNALLVRNGFARVEIVYPNNTNKKYFLQQQQDAINADAGFWALPEAKQPFVQNGKGEYVPVY